MANAPTNGDRPDRKLSIAMVLFPRLTLLDLIGPATALAFYADIHLVSSSMKPVSSDQGVTVLPTCTFDDCPEDLDVLFVPGGMGVIDAMVDVELLRFVRDRGERAGYVASVCTGSLIQGAAGLLKGYRATSHWGWHDVLASFGAIPVKQRVVTDRNRMSGGGVTAGLDFGLTLLASLRGEEAAKSVQLMMEYDPAPPFDVGTPDKAGEALVRIAEQALNAPNECATMIARQKASGFLLDTAPAARSRSTTESA
ncbi:DJ-1/PfpI family protein [Bradyrhizobium sp. LTSPM299]|uniref:DJ-1/PfpI family protein n=1 Tax=Bradyrhizobium sp. LTSPM299 TaxID=1619233 RepID=UPI000679B189|nr:DJ-1/PfpI family protein [Bradyrhizobium sp. LTSPM299]